MISLAYSLHALEHGVSNHENNSPWSKRVSNIEYRGVGHEVRDELERAKTEGKPEESHPTASQRRQKHSTFVQLIDSLLLVLTP